MVVLLARCAVAQVALGQGAHHPRRFGHAAAGRTQRAAERGAGDEDRADEQQEDDEDADADVLHETMRELKQRGADHAAVGLHEGRAPRGFGGVGAGADAERAGGQGKCDPGEQADRADRARVARQRAPGRQHFAQQERAAGADERERHEHAGTAERPAEGDRQAVAGAAPVPAAPQHEAHEHADGDERQPEHVAPALAERPEPAQTLRQQRSEQRQPRPWLGSAGARARARLGARARASPRGARRGALACAWHTSPTSTPSARNLPAALRIYAFWPYHRFSARRYIKTMNDFSRAPRVLVVEDDEDIAQALQRSLRMEGYEVRAAPDGPSALENGRSFAPDLVILDLGLPGLDGVEVAKTLRAEDDVPILILTARDALESRVEGLDAGADDYLVKPFERQELLARMRALLRRRPPRGSAPLRVGDLSLNVDTHEVVRGERTVDLTQREFELLEYLMRNERIVISRQRLLDEVWGYDPFSTTNTIEVFVSNLRRKLEAEGEPRLLHTIRGAGYVLRA